MKECPKCGYIPPKPQPKVDCVYFREMPLKAMMKRGWIPQIPMNQPSKILDALMEFFDCKTVEEFKDKLGYEGELFDT